VSIVGRDFQVTEEPIGFVSAGDFAKVGAATGAWAGGLFGLLVGTAFLVLPGVGALVVAGPLAAALLGGIEGAVAGAVIGALAGALVSWGVPKEKAIKYESQVKAGKFLVIVRGTPEKIERAKALLATGHDEGIEVYETASV
jgi:membrane protein DedA with SNARE-associated domain